VTEQEILDLAHAIERESYRRDFRAFVRGAWSIVESAQAFRGNWHIDAICDHLQGVTDGLFNRLIINIPPGHAKSLLVSVLWPAWVWLRRPQWRALFVSYADSLSTRDSVRCRDLIDSAWYQGLLTDDHGKRDWSLLDDMNTKHWYKNSASGERFSTSLKGSITGFRGDAVVVDDLLNAKDAESEIEREKANRLYDESISSRVNDPATAAFVVVMQRLHEGDLTGHLKEKGGWEILSLPAEYDPETSCTTRIQLGPDAGKVFFEDPREEKGELLFPALYTPRAIGELKTALRSAFSGQYNQDPTPYGGLLFNPEWWMFWKHDGTADAPHARPVGCDRKRAARVLPKGPMIMSLDATFKEFETSDYVVFTVWLYHKADRFLIDMVRGKMSFMDTVAAMRALCKKHRNIGPKLVEDKANGTAIINMLRSEIPGIIPINPLGGKESRAQSIQHEAQGGNIYLPESAPWLADFVDEFRKFPKGKHDDIVDSTTQALVHLATSPELAGFLAMAR